MFAIKGRNPIIIAPHPFAMNVAIKTVNLINKEFEKVGAPKNIIQVVDVKSMDITKTLMSLADVVVATGGAAMVKSVYSSGRPAFGVGAGNVQVLVDSDVDFDNATSMIVNGRSFDNGIICTGEQSVIAPRKHYDKVLEGLEKAGAFVIPNEKRDEFRDAVFPNGEMAREVVGKDAYIIAKSIGIDVPKSTRVLVVEANGSDDILGSEKMFPVLASYKYDSWADAIKIANSNLNKMGAGHSVCVHSNNKEHIKEVSLNVNVSRFVINQVCASSGGGSFFNGLNPTNTLGCGSWGNNSISENLTYYHMFNVSRIANIRTDIKTAPSDNEIWS
jgi:succinate-semialdehyde dehydrogenase